MITFLSKIFLKNADSMSENKRRSAYGTLCCCVGIFLNIILFGIKFFAGIISGSIAITADAFNNLSDAGSSAITLAGIQLANKKPAPSHPFGHGRIEYLSALAVSVIIVVVGFELLTSSIDKIRNPEAVEASIVSVAILVISVLVKGYMFFYNRRIGEKINSAGMKATAADCIGDSIATTVVLVSTIISFFTDVQIDGWCGILVSGFIMYAGFSSAKEIVGSLLGSAPDDELVEKIESVVMSYDEVVGIHDLIVHDYGPARLIISLHAEVDGKQDIFMLHDAIDNIEQHLAKELNCIAVIHMDPIETDNDLVSEMKNAVIAAVASVDENITIHDFRMVPGNTHTNLIFDAVVPFTVKMTESEIKKEICSMMSQKYENCNCVVTIDRPFV